MWYFGSKVFIQPTWISLSGIAPRLHNLFSWIQRFIPEIQSSCHGSKLNTPDPMSSLKIQGHYPGFKVITADPKLFLRIKSYYSGSKVITPDPRFSLQIHRSNSIQNLDTGIWRRDIQFTFQHGGCSRWEVEEVPFPSFSSLNLFHRSRVSSSYFFLFFEPTPILSYFLAGETKICNKIETRIFRCLCL